MITRVLTVLALSVPACALGHGESVEWQSGGATIRGQLDLPRGAGPFPAIVFVPGSGSLGRTDVMARAVADRLVEQGFAVLTYDKRGVGRSTGSWRDETFADYAADAIGGIEVLRADARILHSRIGVVAHSQGGWIAPIVARQTGAVAFLILLSSTPLTPLEQSVYVARVQLQARISDSATLARATQFVRTTYDVYQSDTGWAAARRTMDSLSAEPWFDSSLLGLQADTAWNVRWLRLLPFDFDVTPLLDTLSIPILTVNGAEDPLVPAEETRAAYQRIAAGKGHLTSIILPNLVHTLGRTRRDGPEESVWQIIIPWLKSR